MKEQIVNKSGTEEGLCDAVEGTSGSEETQSPMMPSDTGLATIDLSVCSSHSALENAQSSCIVADETCYPENGDADQYWEHQVQQESAQREPTLLHRPVLRPLRYGLGGFHSQVSVAKPMVGQKHNGFKDTRPASVVNSQMVWTRKNKLECEEEGMNCREKGTRNRSDGIESCKVLIGSISVTLKDCNDFNENRVSLGQNSVQEKLVKTDFTLNNVNQSSEKLHVDRQEDGIPETVQCDNREADIAESPDTRSIRILPDQSCLADCGMGDCRSEMARDSLAVSEVPELSVPKLFSSKVAAAFLSQRWKEALTSDHVKLVLSPVTEARSMDDVGTPEKSCADAPDMDTLEESSKEVPPQPLDCSGLGHLENRENQDSGMASIEPASTNIYKPKFRVKPEKSYTLKYIAKQS